MLLLYYSTGPSTAHTASNGLGDIWSPRLPQSDRRALPFENTVAALGAEQEVQEPRVKGVRTREATSAPGSVQCPPPPPGVQSVQTTGVSLLVWCLLKGSDISLCVT